MTAIPTPGTTTAQVPPAIPRSCAAALLFALRPRQWLKNLVVLAPVLFAHRLFEPAVAARAALAFVLFCGLSGAAYLLNDLVDVEADRRHPRKRLRPLAAGTLSARTAVVALSVLGAASLAGSLALGRNFAVAAAAYAALNVAYSLVLKHVVLVDVFVLASGFVIRVAAGAAVVGVLPSPWLFLCTLFLALFLAVGKRRHELNTMENAHEHRRSLADYSTLLIDQMVAILAAITVTTYALYTIAASTVVVHGTDRLIYTVPFVLFGIFRYLYLIYQRDGGDRPEHALLSDRTLYVTVLLWGAASAAIIYLR